MSLEPLHYWTLAHIQSSGIGRSVAILMAREGADISIVYLPQEQTDAEDTKRMVEAENRTCLLLPGDLRKYDFCRHAVEEHVKQYVDHYHSLYALQAKV